jgi:hypothetical protein
VLLVHGEVVDQAEVDDVDPELGVDDLLESLDRGVELLRGEGDGHGQLTAGVVAAAAAAAADT